MTSAEFAECCRLAAWRRRARQREAEREWEHDAAVRAEAERMMGEP